MGHVAAVAAFRDDRSSCRAGRPVRSTRPAPTVRHPLAAARRCPHCSRRRYLWSGPAGPPAAAGCPTAGLARGAAVPPAGGVTSPPQQRGAAAAMAAHAPPRWGANRHARRCRTADSPDAPCRGHRAARGTPEAASAWDLRFAGPSVFDVLVFFFLYRITAKHSPSHIPKRGHKSEGGATTAAQVPVTVRGKI